MATQPLDNLGALLSLSPEEIELRKKWLGFGVADEAIIKEIDQLIGNRAEELVSDMYAHFLAFEETRSFFPDEKTLDRAKSAQVKYFERLTKGNYDESYVSERLKVGATHYRIDLDPKWYMGAYCHVISWITAQLAEHYAGDSARLTRAISAISRLVFFDMGLAIDTYMGAKERAIRQHMDAVHELQTDKRATKAILENAPIGIVRLDERFCCVECNQEFLNIVEAADREAVMGQPFFEVAPALERQLFEDVMQSGHPIRRSAEPLLMSGSGKQRAHYDWAVWPVKDNLGKMVGLVAKFTNVTDSVLLQQQREDFVATLTHDLKTPILAANRAVKLLIEGDFGPIADSQVEILQTIHESNEALYKLVLTLLDVYRYDSGAKQLRIKPYDLKPVINTLIAELSPLADTKRIKLITSLPEHPSDVLCDKDEIRRVVQNLMDNSLKFTPAGGSITVRMSQDEEKTTVEVVDTGKGVRADEKGKLFERFWQAASSGRYYASTGLGLYLCRKIIEMHGGRIWCESEEGKGSTFGFTIENPVN